MDACGATGKANVFFKTSRFLLLTILAVAFAQNAQASEACERLRDRLVSMPQADGSNPEVDRYASAIAQQNLELRKARQDYRNLRCETSSIVVYRADGGNACKDQRRAIEKMETNRDILTEKLQSLRARPPGEGTPRDQILAVLAQNGCATTDDISTVSIAEPERTPYLETLTEAQRLAIVPQPSWPTVFPVPPGPLRTLCVRTCDGAFFPISSGTTAINFARDADQCRQMCPTVQTELYFHALTSGDAADMMSASTGRRYEEMPNAFRYRNARPGDGQQCGCDLQGYHERIRKQQTPVTAPEYQSSIVTLETPSAPTAVTETVAPPAERPMEAADRTVRSVGPVFLPQNGDRIDLRNPASQGPQPLQE